jgi:hypothetical protein
MLLARGWQEDPELWLLLRKDGLAWGSYNEQRDSSLSSAEGDWQIEFPGSVPARVIVAACQAADQPRPPRKSGAIQRQGAAR